MLAAFKFRDNPSNILAPFKWPLFFTLCLTLLSLYPEIYENIRLRLSFWGVALSLLIWQLLLLYHSAAVGRTMGIGIRITRVHYVQGLVQLCIYLYWGWHWRNVYDQATLILAQLIFAYVFDVLLCWSRKRQWILGFGPLPIVLSTNLFLWFKDDWFVWQFAMIAIGQLGKEFFRWSKDGRITHIFNPSAFSLTVFSIGLLATGNTELTWGPEIAKTLLRPNFIYLEIFLLGLVVQYFFSVTLVILSAVAALYLLNLIYSSVTGLYFFIDINIPIAVFLGLHLLVTDPSTSPRSGLGRVLFGALYGICVFALYGILAWMRLPTFYDKLLCVPMLNLAIQLFDRWGEVCEKRFLRLSSFNGWHRVIQSNIAHIGIWLLFFSYLYSTEFLGKERAGVQRAYWRQACNDGSKNGCRTLITGLAGSCNNQGVGKACNELAVILDEGKIVQRTSFGAASYFQKACDLGFDEACKKPF